MASCKKIPKDPNAPKRPITPYFFFVKEVTVVVRDELSKDPTISGSLTTAVAKECGRRWHALSEEEKKKYHMMYKKDVGRYNEEMLSYTPSEEFKEKVKMAKLKHDTTVNKLHSNVAARVPHMVRAYFDYLSSTWSIIAASNPRLSPQQVQEEVWRRWSKGESGKFRDKNQNLVENKRSSVKKRKQLNTSPTLKQPNQAFQCFLEQMKGELWKQLPDLPYTDLVKHISAKWEVMTQEEKDHFNNQDTEDRGKHEESIKIAKLENDAGLHVDRDAPQDNDKDSVITTDANLGVEGSDFSKKCIKLEKDNSKSSDDDDLEIYCPEEKGLHAVRKDSDRNSRPEIADEGKQASSSSSSGSSDDSSDDDSDGTETDNSAVGSK